MSETPDTPAKPETSEVPASTAGAEGSAQADVTVCPEQSQPASAADKPAKSEAAAKAETAEKGKPASVADKAAKTEKPSKPELGEKTDPAQKKALAIKADKPASSDPATDKATKADSPDKPAKASKPSSADKTDSADKPVKPAKPAPKPKPEDKPFANFIQEDLLPSLTKSLTAREQAPISLKLVEGERPVVGGRCWMVQGELPSERRFWLCFESDAITSGKTIALAESGSDPSLLESFLIDEKRINQALLESRLLQRLNGQKWFGGN